MAHIELDSVTKMFGDDVVAVDAIDLTIADGEFMVLVGPSGCGKSTLLRMIAGLEEPTTGSISIGDRDVTDLSPRHRDIAMVFQSYALYPHMTVRQNLAYGLKVRRTPKDEIARRVGDVAKLLGLEDLLDRRPAQLSGGQRQRVAMGRAIVREPQAFLMDEPLSNLDAKLRVGMRASLSQLHARLGVTTVYVTHDQVEAMTLGHRVAVMRDGRILQVDAPQTLYSEPRDLFVAAFIGSPAMNLVEAQLEGDAITFGQFRVPLDRDRRPPPRTDDNRARHPPGELRGGRIRPGRHGHDRRARRGARGDWHRRRTCTSRSMHPASALRASRRETMQRCSPRAAPSSTLGSTLARGSAWGTRSGSPSTQPASTSSIRRRAQVSWTERVTIPP